MTLHYRIKEDCTAPHYPREFKAGDTVHKCRGYDYGCASDDTRLLGEEFVSVTLDADGDYPFFTMPVRLLEAVKEPIP